MCPTSRLLKRAPPEDAEDVSASERDDEYDATNEHSSPESQENPPENRRRRTKGEGAEV